MDLGHLKCDDPTRQLDRSKTRPVNSRPLEGKKMKKILAGFYIFVFCMSATFYSLSFFGYTPDLSLHLYIPIMIILTFNYISLKWTDEMEGVIAKKERYKVPARSLFILIMLTAVLQIGRDAFLEIKSDRMLLSFNLFFSLLMSYSYLFGKRYGRIVLFRFFD